MRFLFAHPKKDWDDTRVNAALADLGDLLGEAGVTATVEAGRKAYDRLFAACGKNWDRWAREVGGGSTVDGDPHYDGIIVPGVECARATAIMVEAALDAERPVLSWQVGTSVFRRVSDLVDTDPSSRWYGWTLTLEDR